MIVGIMWHDTNDYHTFESFALDYGAYFYLNNPTLSIRYRRINDVLWDNLRSYLLGALQKEIIFSGHYNYDLLLKEVTQGSLASEFQKWCATFYPDAQHDLCMDDAQFMDPYAPETISLATLMLLDCKIIQFKKPCLFNFRQSHSLEISERACA